MKGQGDVSIRQIEFTYPMVHEVNYMDDGTQDWASTA